MNRLWCDNWTKNCAKDSICKIKNNILIEEWLKSGKPTKGIWCTKKKVLANLVENNFCFLIKNALKKY